MGQYYHPCILRERYTRCKKHPILFSICSWDFGNGAKLMEHSYIGNHFVNAVMVALADIYNGQPFAWVGDYADEVGKNQLDLYSIASEISDESLDNYRKWYDHKEEKAQYRYMLNYTKHQYIVMPPFKSGVWQIHPLPILCATSNGRGGGDYYGEIHKDDVGTWAFNRIGFADELPQTNFEWKEYPFDFTCDS